MPALINGNYAYDIFDHYPDAPYGGDHDMTLTSLSGQTWWTHGGASGWIWREMAYATTTNPFGKYQDPCGYLFMGLPHSVALLDSAVSNYRVIIGLYGRGAGIAFRCTHSGDDWEGFYTDWAPGHPAASNGTIRIIKREAGAESVVASVDGVFINPSSYGQVSVLEVRASADTIEVVFNAVGILTYTSSFNIGGRECGIVSAAVTDGTYNVAALYDIYVRPLLIPQVCGAMDICFIIDHTGSMSTSIDNIKAGVESIVDDIVAASGGDYRLALVTVDDPIEVIVNFADENGTAFSTGVAAIIDGYGFNLPEVTDEALHTVLIGRSAADCPTLDYYYTNPPDHPTSTNIGQWGDFSVPWRDGVIKIIVLITDAPPAGFDDECDWDTDMPRAASFAVMAAVMGIRIVAIARPGNGEVWPRGISQSGHDYADITHGVFGRIATSGDGLTEAIREAILACGGFVNRPAVIAQLAG